MQTTRSLQNIIDHIIPTAKNCGLSFNRNKSFTINWLVDGKNKRTIFDHRPFLEIENQKLKSLKVDETFKYLGVTFNTRGRNKIKVDLKEILNIQIECPMKPQQKIFMLQSFIIPSFMHQLTFSKLYSGLLNKLDVLVRSAVRKILHLPHDVPSAIFYASVRDGGLGLTT